jgi:hypothetical protein
MCANYPQESRKNDGQLSKSAHGPTSAGLFFSAQALSRGFLRDASVTTAEPAIFEFVINLKTAKALAEEVPADEARAFSYIACQLSPHVPTWPVAALLSINGGLRFLITAVVVTTSAMFFACLLRGALPTVAWGILAFEFDRSHSKNRLFESAISINVDDGRAPILALLVAPRAARQITKRPRPRPRLPT